MKLYHGTNIEFAEIELDKCPSKRDFGRGFYLTSIYKHAEERACNKTADEGGIKTVMESLLSGKKTKTILQNTK